MDAVPRMIVRRDESLPRLAWYAVVDRRSDTCDVEVGRFVEVDPAPEPRWVVAGFWDGDFAAGHFHTAEHVFGSGLRLDGDEVVVVPAHTTVDRCLFVRDGQQWHVSNSMVVLLGRLGARLDPQVDHRRWSESSCLGVNNYVRQFWVAHPRFQVMNQLLFEAMHLDARGEASFRCHDVPHHFTDFHDCVSQYSGALKALWKNATDARRTRPMRAVASVSRGYDSPTVLALVQPLMRAPLLAWTSAKSNTRLPAVVQKLMHENLSDDDGSQLAGLLGAEPRHLDLDETHLPAELEAWCWASTQSSPELVFHAMLSEADTHDVPTIFFAGHNGDGVWEAGLSDLALSGQLIRGSPSGVSPVPAQIVALSLGATASAPIACTGWSSKMGRQLAPPSVDFQIPPDADPAYQSAVSPSTPAIEAKRPPVAGPRNSKRYGCPDDRGIGIGRRATLRSRGNRDQRQDREDRERGGAHEAELAVDRAVDRAKCTRDLARTEHVEGSGVRRWALRRMLRGGAPELVPAYVKGAMAEGAIAEGAVARSCQHKCARPRTLYCAGSSPVRGRAVV